MWFMRVCPSHFLITFWYWGAYNDSFWNVRVMMCCVFSNSSLLSLQLGPTLLWEMILWIHMNWGVTVLWKERALAWEWMGVPLCRELAQRPRGGGGVTVSPWASSGQWSTRLRYPRGLSSSGLPPPLFLQSLSECTGVYLCLISTGSQRVGGRMRIRLQACIYFT